MLMILRCRQNIRFWRVTDGSPSAHNAQPCRFIILTENGMKKRIAKANAEKWNKDLIKNGVPNDEREMLLGSSKTISF